MKQFYLLLLLALSFSLSQAQIVNIPDANFKNTLLNHFPVVDTNDDGEIQVSEAENITVLNLAFDSIQDLTGIEAFINVVILDCRNNELTSLDLSNNLALFELDCDNNQLTSLILGNNTILQKLDCSGNQLPVIDVSANINLREMSVFFNSLTNLNLSNNEFLEDLLAYNNSLTSLNVNGTNALKTMYVDSNQLTSLDLSSNNELLTVSCSFNLLTDLNISGANQLSVLSFRDNQIANIDLNDNIGLQNLDCRNNLLTSFDISNALYVDVMQLSNNSNLTYINLKNGGNDSLNMVLSNFEELSNLEAVCLDEINSDFAIELQNIVGSDVVLTEYCSFTPGGDYYTIDGVVRLDANSDGCDTNDGTYPSLLLQITNGTLDDSFLANMNGEYFMPIQEGNYTVTPQLENPDYFSISPTNFTVSFPTDASPFTQDFCALPIGTFNDLEIVIVPLEEARPGFNTDYKLVYKNKGNTTLSGSVDFMYNDDFMGLLEAMPTADSQTTGSLSWNYSNLLPFETREIAFTMTLNTPTDIDFPLNGDDILTYEVTINPIASDETEDDNSFTLEQVVVNSFDPNDIRCLEGLTITPEQVGKYVHYLVRFENTGTANAVNIVVKDVIDTSKYDLSSLVPLNASHEFNTRIRNTNEVEFVFENIQLPFDDSNNDGYVLFKIKTLETLVIGDTFTNEAGIYFDFNAPIITNAFTTEVVEDNLSVSEFSIENSIQLYPNPTSNSFEVKLKNDIVFKGIELYSVTGKKIVDLQKINKINTENYQSGIYFVKVFTNKGVVNKRLIKK